MRLIVELSEVTVYSPIHLVSLRSRQGVVQVPQHGVAVTNEVVKALEVWAHLQFFLEKIIVEFRDYDHGCAQLRRQWGRV